MNKKFANVEELYMDMVTRNQSFIKSNNEYCNVNGLTIIEETTIYRLVQLKNGHIEFHGSKYGGSSLYVSGEIIFSECVDKNENGICEYRLFIEGRGESLIMMGCKRR